MKKKENKIAYSILWRKIIIEYALTVIYVYALVILSSVLGIPSIIINIVGFISVILVIYYSWKLAFVKVMQKEKKEEIDNKELEKKLTLYIIVIGIVVLIYNLSFMDYDVYIELLEEAGIKDNQKNYIRSFKGIASYITIMIELYFVKKIIKK